MSIDSKDNKPTREQLWSNFYNAIEQLTASMKHDGYVFEVQYKIDDVNNKA